ncbi:MAG: hypothetical protein SWE60_27305 [Thermodesulfobacteriota bacterium]|nr:hypothetical protein [Thermodesulfobacteriota bacterium]
MNTREASLMNAFERPLWAFWRTHSRHRRYEWPEWANRELLDPPEAGSSCDLVSKARDGSEAHSTQ